MVIAQDEGFNIVMYSKTHKILPKVLHQSLGIRLILSPGMIILFDGCIIHSGGMSRIDSSGRLQEDMRLFCYIWSKVRRSSREYGSNLYRTHFNLCSHYYLKDGQCKHCKDGVGSVLDLSKIDISRIPVASHICGDLETLGWVVVKGIDTCPKASEKIKNVVLNGSSLTRIGSDHGAFMKFSHNNVTPNYRE